MEQENRPGVKGKPAAPARKRSGAQGAITGDILLTLRKWRWPIVYGCVLVLASIFMHFHYRRLQQDIITGQLELNRQRSRAVIFSSMRMNNSRHSYITGQIRERGIGLEESALPPKKLTDHKGIRPEQENNFSRAYWIRQ